MHLLTDLPYSCVPCPCPLPTSLARVINQLMLMPAGSVQFSLTPTEVSSQLLVFTIYSDISPTYSHIPFVDCPHPFPMSFINKLMLMHAGSVRFFTHTCTGKFSIVCVCNLYSDISPTYSHIPMSISHVPCLCHQQTNADAGQFCSIFMHGHTGKFQLLVFTIYSDISPTYSIFPTLIAHVVNNLMLDACPQVSFLISTPLCHVIL